MRVCISQGVCITRTYLQLVITTVIKTDNGILMLADTQWNAKHAFTYVGDKAALMPV
jgi:hypothetical protein